MIWTSTRVDWRSQPREPWRFITIQASCWHGCVNVNVRPNCMLFWASGVLWLWDTVYEGKEKASFLWFLPLLVCKAKENTVLINGKQCSEAWHLSWMEFFIGIHVKSLIIFNGFLKPIAEPTTIAHQILPNCYLTILISCFALKYVESFFMILMMMNQCHFPQATCEEGSCSLPCFLAVWVQCLAIINGAEPKSWQVMVFSKWSEFFGRLSRGV